MPALAAGALTVNSFTDHTASLSSAVATGGTGPYTYQWYRSTDPAFVPGPGNIIDGATDLDLEDTDLLPNVVYYYKVIATDSIPATATSTAATLTTQPMGLDPNQFAQTVLKGTLDQRFNYNTKSVLIDSTQSGTLYAGQPVKYIDPAGATADADFPGSNSIPHVVACDADDDECCGFINFSIKDQGFVANDPCEISQDGNVMYLFSTGNGSSGDQAQLDVANGGVTPAVGSSGANIVGYFIDKPFANRICRVQLQTPTFTFA
jgi:hypothetical protein